MTVRKSRAFVPAPLPEVFDFLASPTNVLLFAPGVEEATLVGGHQGLQGASLGPRTRGGRELRARITHFHEDESWTLVDENATVLQMQVEPARGGTAVTSTLSGNWRPDAESSAESSACSQGPSRASRGPFPGNDAESSAESSACSQGPSHSASRPRGPFPGNDAERRILAEWEWLIAELPRRFAPAPVAR